MNGFGCIMGNGCCEDIAPITPCGGTPELIYDVVEKVDRIQLRFTVVPMGNDLCIAIYGGSRPHIGAVAVAQVRPSLADADNVSATVSMLSFLGHKEGEVASRVAKNLAVQLKKNTVVSCGIHLDDITSEEIRTVLAMSDKLMEKFIKAIQVEYQPTSDF